MIQKVRVIIIDYKAYTAIDTQHVTIIKTLRNLN